MIFFRKILSLDFQLYPLYLEIFLISGLMRILTFFFPFGKLSFILVDTKTKVVIQPNQPEVLEKLTLAINRIAKYTPWRCMCLEQGLTGKFFLRRRKIICTLFIGVCKTEKEELLAHAWLKCGDKILTGKEGIENFKTITSFS